MISAQALERAFREESSLKGFIVPGLALSYQPREYLAIGRADRPPDADDIALVVALAREAFIIVACKPRREVIESNGVAWHLARWPLKRELVADHLPPRERRETDEPEPQSKSQKPTVLFHFCRNCRY